MIHERYELQPIGWVESPLADPAGAPKQGDEGSPDAWLVFDPRFREALRDLQVGADLVVLTWLHRAQRDVLLVHPRGDSAKPLKGVFATRSEDRPNPIGLHPVRILFVQGTRIQVSDLEAIDGTPIVDVKPVVGPRGRR
jgi:tRNA-Thr(GGU) m(6)t(6)A37 methyltransferase TsaA